MAICGREGLSCTCMSKKSENRYFYLIFSNLVHFFSQKSFHCSVKVMPNKLCKNHHMNTTQHSLVSTADKSHHPISAKGIRIKVKSVPSLSI